MNRNTLDFIQSCIATIPDYPKPGIIFRDVTSLIEHPTGFHQTIELLKEHYQSMPFDKVVGTEARGFIFGAPLAYALGLGFIPVRKPGKLPRSVLEQSYQLEYGEDCLQMHCDAIKPGDKVLVVDDKWLAAITQAIQGEMERISQRLANRIKELAERYETPLPIQQQAVADLETKIKAHLEKMGFAW